MNRILSIVFFMFAFLPGIAQQHYYEIHYLSETDENIQLSVMIYGIKEKHAQAYASLYAVQALVFDGIQGSKQRYLPYVQDEQGSYRDHAIYYHNLFNNDGFYSHIIASSIVMKGRTQDKKKYFIVNVNVNFKTLKEDLINHNVIRRFGV